MYIHRLGSVGSCPSCLSPCMHTPRTYGVSCIQDVSCLRMRPLSTLNENNNIYEYAAQTGSELAIGTYLSGGTEILQKKPIIFHDSSLRTIIF